MTPSASPQPRAFLTIWAGQLVSLVGNGLTAFALGIWVFRRTGSTTLFALVTLLSTLPAILVTPVAGVLADRYDRRLLMLLCDVGGAAAILLVGVLAALGRLELWQLYVGLALASLCSGVHAPAYLAVVSQLLPPEKAARASGLMQMARGAQYILAPILAGVLIDQVGVGGIVLLDFFTFLVAIGTLAVTRVPPVPRSAEAREESFLQAFQGARHYLAHRPGIVHLSVLIAAANLMVGFLVVLIGPLVLSFASAQVLGVMNSVAACGILLGTVGLVALKPPERLVPTLLLCLAVAGLAIAALGVLRSPVLLTAATFAFFAMMPVIGGYQETLIRRQVDHTLQGRVFAFNRFLVLGATNLAYAVAGPAADYVFEPLLAGSSDAALFFAGIVGHGRGRGIALLLLLAGSFIVCVSLVGRLLRSIRDLDDSAASPPSCADNDPPLAAQPSSTIGAA
jgi:MFS family permease